MTDGLLPNLTTVCPTHIRKYELSTECDSHEASYSDSAHRSSLKPVNLSSAAYADLSDTQVNFVLSDIRLCIGSLQIQSIGNFDYRLEDDTAKAYPDGYHACRVFWSRNDARQKTVYHLRIDIDQTYHHERVNHRTIEHSRDEEQKTPAEQLYHTCRMTRALVQALQRADHSLSRPLFSYYLPNGTHSDKQLSALLEQLLSVARMPQIDGTMDDPPSAVDSYEQWLQSKFGRVQFTITSDDGYKTIADDLDKAWSDVVRQVRECRDAMNLTHLPMSNEDLTGHEMFGLTKPIVRALINQLYRQSFNTVEDPRVPILPISSSNGRTLNYLFRRKHPPKKVHPIQFKIDSLPTKNRSSTAIRLAIESPSKDSLRASIVRHRSCTGLRTVRLEIDNPMTMSPSRQVLLEQPSVSLRLYHLHYFSQRALLIGASSIHGCGLFTLIDLVEGQMVIEYTGEVVRPCLTDKRERDNERKVSRRQPRP